MNGHTATTLTYVRTSAGVVKVGPGERVPSDALPDEITRLAASGVLAPVPADGESSRRPGTSAKRRAAANPARGQGRSQPGPVKED